MSNSIETLKTNLLAVRYNPVDMQRVVHRAVSDISDGTLDVVDPSAPLPFLIEAACTVGAAIMSEGRVNNRKHYSSMAQTKQDLYGHMSDRDFADIFSTPATGRFIIGIPKDDLLAAMVQVPGSDMRKLVIPRNTRITIADTDFSIQYPIEIRQMAHEGVQVVWDTEKTTPLLNLDTNLIESAPVTDASGVELVMWSMPMQQMSIISTQDTANTVRKFEMTKTIDHQFYYCRVYVESGAGNWVEIPTTYSQEIYPVNKPTAIITVDGKQVKVEIPIVYLKTGLISGKVRADIYQTRGTLSMDLSSYDPKQFIATWDAIDKTEITEYVAPLRNLKSIMLYSRDLVNGGADEMTFEQLRARVMENGFGPELLPITPAQAQSRLARNGYDVVKAIDVVTERVFKATREMPAPADKNLITPANAGIHMLTESVDNLSKLSTTYSNTNSLTISPTTLYKIVNGLVQVVSDAERQFIDAMPGDKKAMLITEGSYFYSPFHYVLDTSNNTFQSRPYYLDKPVVNYRTFVNENDTSLLQVSIGSYQIERSALGWKILLTTVSSKDWKNIDENKVFATIGYKPDRTGDLAYTRGTLIGNLDSGEQVWEFNLNTTYDINTDHAVELSNVMMYENSQQFHRASLTEDFDVFFSTTEPMPTGWAPSEFDYLIGTFLLDDGAVGITHERLNITLGYALTTLWSRSRSVVSEEQYLKWEVDVPAVYETDVYEIDPQTGRPTFTLVDGKVVFNKIHKAGDPQYYADGRPVIRYEKGTVKRDNYGNPIVAESRKITRQLDLFLLEAPYYFATNSAATEYRQLLVDTLVGWLTGDLKDIKKILLDKSSIFYCPKQNVGMVDVVYGAGLKTTISAGQYFKVKIFLRDSAYKNADLKDKLTLATISTYASALASKTVSNSKFVELLRAAYGDDVVSFEQEGLGGTNKLSVCTMVDDAARLTLRKRLVYRNDQTFAVEEDVTVEFESHERSGITLE